MSWTVWTADRRVAKNSLKFFYREVTHIILDPEKIHVFKFEEYAMFESKIISYGQIRELSRTFDWRQLNWPACHTNVFKIVHIRVFVLLNFVYSSRQL